MCYVFQSLNRSNRYVGVWSALVEVSRLVINWPSQTAARYQTKKVIDNKHLKLLRKLKAFRTAITLQDTAFGSVCQVHPLTSTLAYAVHCLKFQDLSLIGPARVLKHHSRQSLRKSWITNISYCVKKLVVCRTVITLQNPVFGTVFRTVDFPYLASCHRKVPFLLMQHT